MEKRTPDKQILCVPNIRWTLTRGNKNGTICILLIAAIYPSAYSKQKNTFFSSNIAYSLLSNREKPFSFQNTPF